MLYKYVYRDGAERLELGKQPGINFKDALEQEGKPVILRYWVKIPADDVSKYHLISKGTQDYKIL